MTATRVRRTVRMDCIHLCAEKVDGEADGDFESLASMIANGEIMSQATLPIAA